MKEITIDCVDYEYAKLSEWLEAIRDSGKDWTEEVIELCYFVSANNIGLNDIIFCCENCTGYHYYTARTLHAKYSADYMDGYYSDEEHLAIFNTIIKAQAQALHN